MSYQNHNEEYDDGVSVLVEGGAGATASFPGESYETTRYGITSERKGVFLWPGLRPTRIGDGALSVALELTSEARWADLDSTRPTECCGWDDDEDDDDEDEDEDEDDFFPDDEDEDFDDDEDEDEDDDYDDEDDFE